jgi:stringent starvation protein B
MRKIINFSGSLNNYKMKYRTTFTPYIVNAFYTWCMDMGMTPLVSTYFDNNNMLPDHLKDEDSIILNIHPNAVRNLVFGKDSVEFEALFNQKPFQVVLYYDSIECIYSKEDGYGLDLIEDNAQRKIHHKPQGHSKSSNINTGSHSIKDKDKQAVDKNGHLYLIKND